MTALPHDQTRPPPSTNTRNYDDSSVRTKKCHCLRAFIRFCLCKSKSKNRKANTDSEGIPSPSTAWRGSGFQPSALPPSIDARVDSYSGVGEPTLLNNTTQVRPTPQQSHEPLSGAISEPSPSDPPNPPIPPKAPRTVEDRGPPRTVEGRGPPRTVEGRGPPRTVEDLSSQGLNNPSPADRPTVQDMDAMEQLRHPPPTVSQGAHSQLINSQPVAPSASQHVPSCDNQQADSQVYSSPGNQSTSSSFNSQSINSYDSQVTSNSDTEPACSCDNKSPPINNNQTVSTGDIQPVPSRAEEITSPPIPTVAQPLSAPPKEQIQSNAEQETSPSTLNSRSPVGEVFVAAFTSDGRYILSCSRHQGLEQWESQTGTRVPLPREMTDGVCTFKISPNGAQVATGCFDGSIRLWGGWRSQVYVVERALLGHTYTISKLIYSPCGRWLVSCDKYGTVRLWDLLITDDKGEVVEPGVDKDIFKDVVFRPTGHEFSALSDGWVNFYDPRNNPCTSTDERPLSNQVYPLDYSQDGVRLAFGSGPGSKSMHVKDPQFDSVFELEGHSKEIVCAAFSPCGEKILSGSRDKTVRLWLYKNDCWSCAAVVPGCSETITCLAWNSMTPREFVTGCHDGSVRVWRVSSAEAGNVSVRKVWGTI
ncbi:MAG: WD40-repeat-containing domain protein [Linnemannia elongata]|nr:MAG: WD40-repeat-containing domain protein [Linnemannia elongata]